MNPIGLPALGQQAILSDCNDLYIIEARAVGSDEWYSFSPLPMPSFKSSETVKRLNAGDTSTVYRSALVQAVA